VPSPPIAYPRPHFVRHAEDRVGAGHRDSGGVRSVWVKTRRMPSTFAKQGPHTCGRIARAEVLPPAGMSAEKDVRAVAKSGGGIV